MIDMTIGQAVSNFFTTAALVKRGEVTVQAQLQCSHPQEMRNDEIPLELAGMGTLATWWKARTAVPAATIKPNDRLTINGIEYIVRQYTPWPAATTPNHYKVILTK